jgi:hypothetical protein
MRLEIEEVSAETVIRVRNILFIVRDIRKHDMEHVLMQQTVLPSV